MMNTHANKTTETKSNAAANGTTAGRSISKNILHSIGSGSKAGQIQETANNSQQVKQLRAIQAMADQNSLTNLSAGPIVQRFYAVKDEINAKQYPKANTGKVDNLPGIEWIDLPDPRDVLEYPDTVAKTGWLARNLYKRKAEIKVKAPKKLSYKELVKLDQQRNRSVRKQKNKEALWEKQGVIFHVNKPDAQNDNEWKLYFNEIKKIAGDDKGFEFHTGKLAINIKYNFIQLGELFRRDLRTSLYNMAPKEEREKGDPETVLYTCFGTPHFMESHAQKKKALLDDSKKIVDEYDFDEFDKKLPTNRLRNLNKRLDKKKSGMQVKHLLEGDSFGGLVIGEAHTEPHAKRFLIEQMINLKRQKVNTIYLEHIRADYQEMIDEWYEKKGAMPDKLKKMLETNDISNELHDELFNLSKLVQHAFDNNVRIVGIDSLHAQYEPDDKDGAELRDMTMNAFAQQVIKSDTEKRKGGKYVAVVGAHHSNTHEAKKEGGAGYSKGLPGLSQQLFIPAVKVDPKKGKLVIDRENKGKRILLEPKKED